MQQVKGCVRDRAFRILERAAQRSEDLISQANAVIESQLSEDVLAGLCFAVVGSVGRKEALEASDFDLVPIAKNRQILDQFVPQESALRQTLAEKLGVKVSKGEDLTKATSIEEMTEPDTIGGSSDTRGGLTKRILLLTESAQAGGLLPLREIRTAILDAYSRENRTSGRHVLTLCNDIARYHKTLCIEYKAKIDEENKDWSTRNIKLRHSRKLWYFANIVTIATLADKFPHGAEAFKAALLDQFQISPIERLAAALVERQPLLLGHLLETYALFLDFMSSQSNRSALGGVTHEKRYGTSNYNPFVPMKSNSDVLHFEIMSILEEMGPAMRARIIGWFLL